MTRQCSCSQIPRDGAGNDYWANRAAQQVAQRRPCSICRQPIVGHPFAANPVSGGACCRSCNERIVVPRRLAQGMGVHSRGAPRRDASRSRDRSRSRSNGQRGDEEDQSEEATNPEDFKFFAFDGSCQLCQGEIAEGQGHHAWPLGNGVCCEQCGERRVLPMRMMLAVFRLEADRKRELDEQRRLRRIMEDTENRRAGGQTQAGARNETGGRAQAAVDLSP
jgi:hypothetical protein